MMFPRLCGHLLQYGARGCDVAVVDGLFAPRRQEADANPFYLDALCDWLDLAGVVVINVSQLQHGHVPERPEHVDAVILDAVDSSREAARWETEIEALWRTPVVGWMHHAAPLRTIAESLSAEARPSPKLCRALGDALAEHLDEDLLLALARRQRVVMSGEPLFHMGVEQGSRVAVGIDEAMSRHFPENLDLLSARGATVVDFSPLRAAELPRDAEVVYLGDGCLHAYARKLASNYCLLVSLRSHLASGGRVYAEGMGAAILGQELIYPNGDRIPMAGILPWSYRLVETSAPASLQTLNVQGDNWLVHGCGRLRGYAGCTRLELVDDASTESPLLERFACVRAWGGAVASTSPLFFPAHPRLVTNLLRPAYQLCAFK
jgi:cobyrinic acid a,c-diamide synthase